MTLPVAASEVPERVYPVAPEDGAVTGSRPVFQLGYDGAEGLPFRQLRFRLTLDPRDPGPSSRDFDQRKRRRGWLPGEPGRVLFRPSVPLGDGVYRWQVRVWDGVQWIGGDRTFEIRVDTVPPAEVRDLEVKLDRSGTSVRLAWQPVTQDVNGRTEYVARYQVYRYDSRGIFPRVRPYLIGVTETPEFVDDAPLAHPVLYYRVLAEDEAGNALGVRD